MNRRRVAFRTPRGPHGAAPELARGAWALGHTGVARGALMDRPTALLLLGLALAAYGVYHALYAITMLPGSPPLVLFLSFALQALLALLAALGVWRRQPWAAAALLLLGATVAATALVEAFVLGIIGWLNALLIAIGSIVIALLLGSYVRRSGPASDRAVE